MAVKTFTQGEVLTASDTNAYLNNGGLVYITQASWTSGTSVVVNNCFTSTYSVYRLVMRNAKHATTAVNVAFRLRAGGTDATTGYYWARRYIVWGATAGGDTGTANDTKVWPGLVATVNNPGSGWIEISDPAKASITAFSYAAQWTDTAGESSNGNGYLNNTTAYDGFSLTANTGNLTGLTVYVYGYRES